MEPPDSDIPDIKLVHLERAREVDADVSMVVRKLEDHIEYEGTYLLLCFTTHNMEVHTAVFHSTC